MKNKKRGFTLIELLVVVLIIGILAAVAIPKYQKAVVRSRAVALKVWAKRLLDLQQVYKAAHGKYAQNFDELGEDFSADFPVEKENGTQLWTNDSSSQYGIRLRVRPQDSSAIFNKYLYSGYGGFGFSHTGSKAGQLYCVEHACHTVSEGSFCQEIMGYSAPYENGQCSRYYYN